MARIVLDLPQHFSFSTEVQVYISHINHGGHLDNARLLSLVSEARVRFFDTLGHTEMNVGGLPIVVADMLVQYRSEAFYGDILRIAMTATDLGRCNFDLVWCITQARAGHEIARGKSGMVFVDPTTRRAAPMPEAVRQQFVALSVAQAHAQDGTSSCKNAM